MKIELHKQFKVPIDGLIPLAEEITMKKEKKAAEDNKPFKKVVKSGESPAASPRAEESSTFDRKAHKKLVKAQQREKRQLKKQLKVAFSSTLQQQAAFEITEAGGIRKGVSVKKIH